MAEVRLTEKEWELRKGKAEPKPKRKTRVIGAFTSLIWFLFCVAILGVTTFNAGRELIDAVNPLSVLKSDPIQVFPFILCFVAAVLTVFKGGAIGAIIGLRGISLVIAIAMGVSVFFVANSSRMVVW